MQAALALEKDVNQCILQLHDLASSHDDPHVSFMTYKFCYFYLTTLKLLPCILFEKYINILPLEVAIPGNRPVVSVHYRSLSSGPIIYTRYSA